MSVVREKREGQVLPMRKRSAELKDRLKLVRHVWFSYKHFPGNNL